MPVSAAVPWRRLRIPPLAVAVSGVRRRRAGVVAAAAASVASPDELHALRVSSEASGAAPPRSWCLFVSKSSLWNLMKDVEPLDLSRVQKDVPPETVDAMKRTVSGMLGLLRSDQFRVVVEALWNPFFKLVVSSIMTGYTLCNAEYRLSLEQILEFSQEETECQKRDSTEDCHSGIDFAKHVTIFRLLEHDELTREPEQIDENLLLKPWVD